MNNEQTFEWAIKFVLQHEGDYVDDDEDPGGETNYGISQKHHPDVDVDALDRVAAIRIYRERYWDRHRCGELHPAMALVLFDGVVNQPADWAVKTLQGLAGTTVDGIVGPKTIDTVNRAVSPYLLQRFMAARVDRYVTRDHYSRFGEGWIRRALDAYATGAAQL